MGTLESFWSCGPLRKDHSITLMRKELDWMKVCMFSWKNLFIFIIKPLFALEASHVVCDVWWQNLLLYSILFIPLKPWIYKIRCYKAIKGLRANESFIKRCLSFCIHVKVLINILLHWELKTSFLLSEKMNQSFENIIGHIDV